MPSPRPGAPVRGSTTGRPIMALLDLLGRRWALRIVWELSQTPAGFRALQARCDAMSPTVLSTRLAELSAAGIVAQQPEGSYALTGEGVRLVGALVPLQSWAEHWAAREQQHADPAV